MKLNFYIRIAIVATFLFFLVGCGTMNDIETKGTSSEEEDKVAGEKESDLKEKEIENEEKVTQQQHHIAAKVSRVVDGDTVKVIYNGKEETVRLLLVDTPETKHPSKPVQPLGPEASSFAKEVLEGEQVGLEFDGPKRDKYDRLLAYLWVDGVMFNQMLLEQGLARLAYVYDPPYNHFEAYMKAQNKAKEEGLGIWSRDGYVTDEGFYYQDEEERSVNNRDTEPGTSNKVNYDPNGPDRDCGDFNTQGEAQIFFEAAGGPHEDPHRLDGNDGDGLVCESLP
ncbi:thermonuclease family protein [Oceanobacillus manasiensis]|uniref:thermonuclease family protein n=1 Tax=Oceanobacillus manasiensis TaxID=586413 RepID=UPI00069418F2|nr:thermonuclease family protein [Oceanobacillus manasiensis]